MLSDISFDNGISVVRIPNFVSHDIILRLPLKHRAKVFEKNMFDHG